MYMRLILIMLTLLLCSCTKQSEKALRNAPVEIVRFFEGDDWIKAMNHSSKSESTQKLNDFKVHPPLYLVKAGYYTLDSSTLICTDEANECRVTIEQDTMTVSFTFHKVDTAWQFKGRSIFTYGSKRKNPRRQDEEYRIKKPIIYLYSPSPIDVQVQLDFEEKLTYCYPSYPKIGWNVTTFPDGTLQRKSDNKKFYSLFWEGQMDFEISIDEGFVVSADSIELFLEDKLPLLGLNFKECQEFIIYWAPLMKKNAYSLIHFSTDDYVKHFPLRVTPKPDSEIRVNMLFKACGEKATITTQILKPGKREGFTLVEWGGTDLDSKSVSVQ